MPIFGSSCGDCLYSEGAASGGLFGSGAYGVHPSLAGLCPSCDQGPSRAVVAFVSYDSWRGVQDGSWQNNGIASGLNFGTRLGRFSDWTGIGFQIGGSAAAYDWAGTDYRTRNQNQAEPQGFVTYGFFRKANESRRVSAALVQDWMINSNFGEFAQNPTLGQWRGQLGYMLSPANEVGVWGTWRLHGDAHDVGGANTIWRPINQLNVYSHHKWSAGGPDTWIWLGVPEHDRLAGGGSLGDWLVGLRGNFPLSDAASVYALVTYMHQSGAAGAVAASEDAWNFSVGLAIYPGAMPVRRPWPAAAGCRPFRWPTTATSWSIRTACSSGCADDYGGLVGVCLDAATSGFSGLEEAGYGRAASARLAGSGSTERTGRACSGRAAEVLFDDRNKLLKVGWFRQHVQDARLDRRVDDVDRGVTGQEDAGQVGPPLAHLAKQVDSVHAGHLVIDDCQPVLLSFDLSERFRAVVRHVGFVAVGRQQPGHHRARVGIVVDDQNRKFNGRPPAISS